MICSRHHHHHHHPRQHQVCVCVSLKEETTFWEFSENVIFSGKELPSRRVSISYVQVYCERVFDLLEPSTNPAALLIRESEDRGVFIEGVRVLPVASVEVF